MPMVSFLLAEKGSAIHSISPFETVLEAVYRMNQSQIGALVVMSGGRVVGMFTERDVLRRVLAESRVPSDVTVGEVMTADVISCEPEMDLDDLSRTMKERRVRHVPVCDKDANLVGLVSIGDLNAYYVGMQEQQIHSLTDYIYGRG